MQNLYEFFSSFRWSALLPPLKIPCLPPPTNTTPHLTQAHYPQRPLSQWISDSLHYSIDPRAFQTLTFLVPDVLFQSEEFSVFAKPPPLDGLRCFCGCFKLPPSPLNHTATRVQFNFLQRFTVYYNVCEMASETTSDESCFNSTKKVSHSRVVSDLKNNQNREKKCISKLSLKNFFNSSNFLSPPINHD